MKLECVGCAKRCEQSYLPQGWKGIRAVKAQKREFWRSHLGWCAACAAKFGVEEPKVMK